MVARMEILLRGGDFAAEAGALFFCKRKNAQKAPLAGSGVQTVDKPYFGILPK